MMLARELIFAPALAAAIAAGGCGSSGSGAGPAAAVPGVIATPPLTADDAPVAQVTLDLPKAIDELRRRGLLSSQTCGVNAAAPEERVTITVWASCVAAQAPTIAAGSDGERRTAARDQCIAFELLAQLAEACGLAAAPEVGQAVRSAEVNRLVETDFEQRYRTPADLAPQIDALVKANEARMHIPQLRASAYARFVVPPHAPAETEARAHALADRLATELAGQTGLYGVHLVEAARRIDDGSGIELATEDVKPSYQDRLVDAYGAALYAIPAVGRTSPALRTPWGWDVVLWTGGIEARDRSRDEVVAEIFPELRRRQFVSWVNQITRRLGVHVEVDQAAVKALDTGGGP